MSNSFAQCKRFMCILDKLFVNSITINMDGLNKVVQHFCTSKQFNLHRITYHTAML